VGVLVIEREADECYSSVAEPGAQKRPPLLSAGGSSFTPGLPQTEYAHIMSMRILCQRWRSLSAADALLVLRYTQQHSSASTSTTTPGLTSAVYSVPSGVMAVTRVKSVPIPRTGIIGSLGPSSSLSATGSRDGGR